MPVGYAPAAFLVDEQFMVRGCYGNTEFYLRAPSDTINVQLFKLVRDELVFELSDLIKQAGHFGKEIKKDGIVIGAFGHTRTVTVEIVSLRSFGRNWWLIVIRDALPVPAAFQPDKNPDRLSKELRIEALEKRLHEMQGFLMSANEQAADTLRTLQRIVEETTAAATKLQTYNQELQSLAEYGLAIIDGLRYGIVALRDDGTIHSANPAFYTLFGWEAAKVQGISVFEAGDGVLDKRNLHKALETLRTTGAPPARLKLRLTLPERRELILGVGILRLSTINNLPGGAVLIIEDIKELQNRSYQRSPSTNDTI